MRKRYAQIPRLRLASGSASLGMTERNKMKEILLQIAAMTIGFIGGVMYTREVYRPVLRALKKAERELHRREKECGM